MHKHSHAYTHIHTNMYTYLHARVHTHMNTSHRFICCAGRGNQACFLNYITALFKHFVLKWGLAPLPRMPSNLVTLPRLLGQLGLQACLTMPANPCFVLIMFCKRQEKYIFTKLYDMLSEFPLEH